MTIWAHWCRHCNARVGSTAGGVCSKAICKLAEKRARGMKYDKESVIDEACVCLAKEFAGTHMYITLAGLIRELRAHPYDDARAFADRLGEIVRRGVDPKAGPLKPETLREVAARRHAERKKQIEEDLDVLATDQPLQLSTIMSIGERYAMEIGDDELPSAYRLRVTARLKTIAGET